MSVNPTRRPVVGVFRRRICTARSIHRLLLDRKWKIIVQATGVVVQVDIPAPLLSQGDNILGKSERTPLLAQEGWLRRRRRRGGRSSSKTVSNRVAKFRMSEY